MLQLLLNERDMNTHRVLTSKAVAVLIKGAFRAGTADADMQPLLERVLA